MTPSEKLMYSISPNSPATNVLFMVEFLLKLTISESEVPTLLSRSQTQVSKLGHNQSLMNLLGLIPYFCSLILLLGCLLTHW